MEDSLKEAKPGGESTGNVEKLDILGGKFGFHYTVDAGLPGTLTHGLLSRMEDRSRGTSARIRESRSVPTYIYFTTRINDLYFRGHPDQPATLQDKLKDVVGIAIDRPNFAQVKEGHFAMEHYIEPSKFRALVFVDSLAEERSTQERKGAHDKYRFKSLLPPNEIEARVAALRKISEEASTNIPIYGVSGELYWPPMSSTTSGSAS